jgi:hypothetical protein
MVAFPPFCNPSRLTKECRMQSVRANSLILTMMLGTAAVCLADNSEAQPLPLQQVPQAVMKAVLTKFPAAKPQSAAQGVEGNQPYIDVHILVNNQKIWVTCNPSGKINVIDREITLKELPAAVTAALNKKYPQAKVRLVNEITDEGQPTYDIAVTFQKKAVIGVFAANGEFLEEMEDDE